MNLVDIPFLKYKRIENKIWSTIQWKGLDKGIYASPDEWKYAKYEISEKDSADLKEFEFSSIEKYETFGKELKKLFNNKFISIVNYDEGYVYIIVHNDDIAYKEDKKETKKKYKEMKTSEKIEYENRNIKLIKNILESYPFVHEDILRLYNSGLNDRYISITIRKKYPEINLTENKILGWRKINKLPANKTFGNIFNIDEIMEKNFLEHYNKGLNDLTIGIILGINPGKIAAWRARNNLRANRKNIKNK